MDWFRVFLAFDGRLDRERYRIACRVLSFACVLPAVLLYRSDITIRVVWMFLPGTWPFLALTIKRLRDSGRSVGLAVPLMGAWLLAAASSFAGAVGAIDGRTTITGFGLGIVGFCMLQDKIGKFPPAASRPGPV